MVVLAEADSRLRSIVIDVRAIAIDVRGISSVGRAFGWQPKGHRFEPGILHSCWFRGNPPGAVYTALGFRSSWFAAGLTPYPCRIGRGFFMLQSQPAQIRAQIRFMAIDPSSAYPSICTLYSSSLRLPYIQAASIDPI